MTSIKQQMFSGIYYTALAKYSGIIISLVVTAILARLLSPDDFGVVAVATIIINFFSIFTNIGFSSAIIQNKELTKKDYWNIYSFTIWLGLVLGGLFFLSSQMIADYYGNVQLVPICRLLSVSLFFSAASTVSNSLFFKDKDFKFIAYRTLFIQILSGVLSVIAAFVGAGLYTLTIQPILSSLLIFVVSLNKYPQKFCLTLGLESVKRIWNYSIYQFLFNLVNYFTRNVDKLLIGKFMGMSPLGYYEKSYRLMMMPLQNITYVITPVMHPILSDYQHDKQRLGNAHERLIRLLAFIGFPLGVILYFCASELILIFFGNQWLPSIPVFKILSLTVGIQLLLSSSGSFYQAGNDTRGMFICGIFSTTVSVAAILTGLFYFGTLEATAWCILLSFGLSFVQCYHLLYHSLLKRKVSHFYRQLSSPLILSFILSATLYLISPTLEKACPEILSLVIKTIFCLIISVFYIQFTKEYNLYSKLKSVFRKYKSSD